MAACVNAPDRNLVSSPGPQPFFASTKPSSYPAMTQLLGAEWWRRSEGGLPQEASGPRWVRVLELFTFYVLLKRLLFPLSSLSAYPTSFWSLGFFPQVLFFPEGTCSNKKALLKFKPGE